MKTEAAHMGAVVMPYPRLKMVGVLARPEGPAKKKFPAVLFLHGFPGSEQNVDIRRKLLSLGIGSFALHFSGAWGSDGYYSFSRLLPQAQAALRFLAAQDFVDKKRLAVFGFSMGGWTAINLAARERSLKACCAVAPVGGPEMIGPDTRSHVAHLSRTLRIRSVDSLAKDFKDSVKRYDPALAAAKLSCPLLLVHGTGDGVVPSGVSRRIYQAAAQPKRLVVSPGAGHDFLDRRDWLTRVAALWLARQLSR